MFICLCQRLSIYLIIFVCVYVSMSVFVRLSYNCFVCLCVYVSVLPSVLSFMYVSMGVCKCSSVCLIISLYVDV